MSESAPTAPPTLDEIRAASERLVGLVHRTPVIRNRTLDRLAGRRLFLKGEHVQRIGAFKIRGASNFIAQLGDEEAARGVVTHSSGNHAQAVALAARRRGIAARIVMPRTAAKVKLEAVEGYGAEVVLCEPTSESRQATASEIVERTGGVFVHPFDHPHIVAGQATAAVELLEEVDDLDAIVVPVGGGGLASGTCLAVRALAPNVKVYGAEPLGADDAARSFASGQRLPQTDPRTIADGLLTGLGELTWPILRDHLESVATVEEGEIVAAMRTVWERTKQVIEPSAAVAVAAALGDELRGTAGLGRVGIVISGGNVDLGRLPWQG